MPLSARLLWHVLLIGGYGESPKGKYWSCGKDERQGTVQEVGKAGGGGWLEVSM